MRQLLYNKAINEAMHEEMERDETVYLIGQECSQDTWGTSGGLFKKFGSERIRNSAISEAAIIGSSVGAALTGSRPVANMMFADFIMCGADELFYKAAKWRLANGGKVTIPLVIRAPHGGYSGIGPEHSQTMEGYLMHTPGLKVAIPSTPYDAKGLLKTAIRDNNPVVFLEHKVLMGMKGDVPEEEYTIPFGSADIKREGGDVTVVATGYLVSLTLKVADILQEEKGISVEVVDPRTIAPLDMDTIIASVKKTHKVVVACEDTLCCGPGAEIGMQIMERAFDYLDDPIIRIGAENYPIAGGRMERFILPQPQQISDRIAELMGVEDGIDLNGRVTARGIF